MTSPPNADLLSRAARALRDDANNEAELDGSSAVGAWQGMHGWHDVSRDVRRAARRRRVALIAGLQLVAAVVGVGAWAAVSGRLPALFSPRPPAVRPPAPAYHVRTRRPAPVPDEPPAPPEAPEPAVDVAVPVSPPRAARPARPPDTRPGRRCRCANRRLRPPRCRRSRPRRPSIPTRSTGGRTARTSCTATTRPRLRCGSTIWPPEAAA